MKLTRAHLFVYLLAFFVVPAATLGLYSMLGSPNLPDHPLQSRHTSQSETMSQAQVEAILAGRARATDDAPYMDSELEQLVARLEARLAETPGNTRGYFLLGQAMAQTRNHSKAWPAFAKAYSISQDVRHAVSQLENMVAAANGYISSDSLALLKTLEDVDNFRIPYYQGVAAAQNGNMRLAASKWAQMLELADIPPQMRTHLREEVQRAQRATDLAQ